MNRRPDNKREKLVGQLAEIVRENEKLRNNLSKLEEVLNKSSGNHPPASAPLAVKTIRGALVYKRPDFNEFPLAYGGTFTFSMQWLPPNEAFLLKGITLTPRELPAPQESVGLGSIEICEGSGKALLRIPFRKENDSNFFFAPLKEIGSPDLWLWATCTYTIQVTSPYSAYMHWHLRLLGHVYELES